MDYDYIFPIQWSSGISPCSDTLVSECTHASTGRLLYQKRTWCKPTSENSDSLRNRCMVASFFSSVVWNTNKCWNWTCHLDAQSIPTWRIWIPRMSAFPTATCGVNVGPLVSRYVVCHNLITNPWNARLVSKSPNLWKVHWFGIAHQQNRVFPSNH